MKKVILLVTVMLVISVLKLQAQAEKGRFMIEGASDMQAYFGAEKFKSGTSTEKNYSYSGFGLTNAVGYFVLNRFPIGMFMDLDIYCHRAPEDGEYDSRTASFIIGPFAKYYFVNLNGLMPYVMVAGGFGVNNYRYRVHPDGDWSKINEGYFAFRAGGGLTYFCTKQVGIDAFLGFNNELYVEKDNEDGSSRASDNDKYIYNELLFHVGIVVSLGKE